MNKIVKMLYQNSLNMSEFFDATTGQLSCAHRQYLGIPLQLSTKYGDLVKRLDLSHNLIKSLRYLELFPRLEEIVLDHNEITADTLCELPSFPQLRSLSLNKNAIGDLDRAVETLQESCPNLSYLSLLGNTCCPDQLTTCSSGRQLTEEDYSRYRMVVLCRLPSLKFLDSRPITDEECRQASIYLIASRLARRLKEEDSESSENSGDERHYHPLPVIIPSGTRKTTYRAVTRQDQPGKGQSEGNRYIVNKQL